MNARQRFERTLCLPLRRKQPSWLSTRIIEQSTRSTDPMNSTERSSRTKTVPTSSLLEHIATHQLHDRIIQSGGSLQPLTERRRSQRCDATLPCATPFRIEDTDLHQRCGAFGSYLFLLGGKVAAASRTTPIPAYLPSVTAAVVSAVAEHRSR